jgi:putative tricarboxylic transport membrane protein
MNKDQRGIVKMEVYIGLTVVGLGAVLALGLSDINLGAGYDRIGPRFFPYVVAIGLFFLGGWFLVSGLLHRHADGSQGGGTQAAAANLFPVVYLAAALIANLLLLERAGFVIASAIQFWLVARAFGSRRVLRDAIVAVLLALTCFIAFSNGLGLSLPSGILEGIL